MEKERNLTKRTNRTVKQSMLLIGKEKGKNNTEIARESNLSETAFRTSKEHQKINADAFVEFMANNPDVNFEYFVYEGVPMLKTDITQIGQNNQQGDNNTQNNQTGNNNTQNNIQSLDNQFNFAANAADNVKIIKNYFESKNEGGKADENARRTLDRLDQQVAEYDVTLKAKDDLINVLKETVEFQKSLLTAKNGV